MLKLIILSIFWLTSCSVLESMPYEEPKAAVFQDKRNIITHFKDHRTMICSLYNKDGEEEFSWIVLDGDSIDLSNFNSGEYLVVIKDLNKVLYTKSINLK